MSFIAIANIIIVNVIAWVCLSYFWSFWTHRLFKPWGWQEKRKRKLLAASVERAERGAKDRVRYYAHFFAMEQVERQEVAGDFAMVGVEDASLLDLLRQQCPQRHLWAVGPMEATSVTIRHENCQGEVSEETVALDFVPEADVRRIMPEGELNHVLPGAVGAKVCDIDRPLALVSVDCVEHDDLKLALEHLYGLLQPGGVMIVHSYEHTWPGVRAAVDTFMARIPEGFVQMPDMYGSIALVKNKKTQP